MVPAAAVNVAVVLPTPTVTDVGSVSAAALSERVTVAPPVFDTVPVQVGGPPRRPRGRPTRPPARVGGPTRPPTPHAAPPGSPGRPQPSAAANPPPMHPH